MNIKNDYIIFDLLKFNAQKVLFLLVNTDNFVVVPTKLI